jgi:hypothetical protein
VFERSRETKGERELAKIPQLEQGSIDHLEKALHRILGDDRTTNKLSKLLAYTSVNDSVSYQEIRKIIKDDPEDVLLVADKWRLLLPVRTTKSAAWEDRILLLQDGEIYEIPNVIRYLVKNALDTGKWDSEKAIIKLFREFEDPYWKQIAGLVKIITEKATDYTITSNQIKKICLQFGLSNKVDWLIAELKAAGIISPRLGSIPDVIGAQSPIYEINPAIII